MCRTHATRRLRQRAAEAPAGGAPIFPFLRTPAHTHSHRVSHNHIFSLHETHRGRGAWERGRGRGRRAGARTAQAPRPQGAARRSVACELCGLCACGVARASVRRRVGVGTLPCAARARTRAAHTPRRVRRRGGGGGGGGGSARQRGGAATAGADAAPSARDARSGAERVKARASVAARGRAAAAASSRALRAR